MIWATGYGLDYGWIDVADSDELGYPQNVRGVSAASPASTSSGCSAALPGVGLAGRARAGRPASVDAMGPQASQRQRAA